MNNKFTTIFILMILSLTCQACSSNAPTQQLATSPSHPSVSPLIESKTPATQSFSPAATASTPPAGEHSTPTPTQVPLFFTEDWADDPIQWFWFSTKGNDNLWDIYTEVGVLEMSLTGKEISVYFIYRPWEYEQVRITSQFENRAFATSSAVIVCNYTEALGWYEFDIGSDGLWQIRAHDTLGHTGYLILMNGGSKSILTREAVNEISATCIGNSLSLTINGTEVAKYTDKVLKFSKGKVGLGAISKSQIPVLIESDWVRISKP